MAQALPPKRPRDRRLANDCPRCHGEGLIFVGEFQLNSRTGESEPVNPDEMREDVCPTCFGSGIEEA